MGRRRRSFDGVLATNLLEVHRDRMRADRARYQRQGAAGHGAFRGGLSGAAAATLKIPSSGWKADLGDYIKASTDRVKTSLCTRTSGADEVIIPENEGGLMAERMIEKYYPIRRKLD